MCACWGKRWRGVGGWFNADSGRDLERAAETNRLRPNHQHPAQAHQLVVNAVIQIFYVTVWARIQRLDHDIIIVKVGLQKIVLQ